MSNIALTPNHLERRVSRPVEMTSAQRDVLERKFNQDNQDMTWHEFLNSAETTVDCDNAIAVEWGGRRLCIEIDGCCHS